MRKAAFPLWPVPLAIGITWLFAGHLAWWLSVRGGFIDACNPYWEGCTSVSRAARHGLGNYLFRLLMLPCALLVALHWWLGSRWLREEGRDRDPGAARLFVAGLVAAHALAVYVAFLGTGGSVYAFMRSYGVTLFFGGDYLAQLLFVYLAGKRGRLPARMRRALLAPCVLILALGVAKLACDAWLDEAAADRIGDAIEWQVGALLAAWYLLQAWAWRGERATLGFGAE
jgi:hypothetical protein